MVSRIVLEPMKDPKDYLELEDIQKMFDHAKNLRDKALIYTLFFTGRRVSEVLEIRVKDILWGEKSIHFTILKKKTPMKVLLPVHEKVLDILFEYLNKERLLEHRNAYVFYSPYKGREHHLSRRRVDQIIRKLGRELGIKTKAGKLPHAHCFRHSFAIWFASRIKTPDGVSKLKEMLQHSSVELTMYYAKRFGGELRRFWDSVDLPF